MDNPNCSNEGIPLCDCEGYTFAKQPSSALRLIAVLGSFVVGATILWNDKHSETQFWVPSKIQTNTRLATSWGVWRQHARSSSQLQSNEAFLPAATYANSHAPVHMANATLGSVAALGTVVGAGLMALYQTVSRSRRKSDAGWTMAAVADASVEMDLSSVPETEQMHLPPYAGSEPFRPDIFQTRSEVGTIVGTDIKYVKKRNWWFPRTYNGTDIVFILTTFSMHAVAFILGPMTYRPDCLALAAVMYVITGMFGITLSFHRQLSHRSFTTPKWLEYIFAYCGVLALQGDPLEWVSSHRYHHLYCETDRDPHTVNEGLWWSHMGWLLDNHATKARTDDHSNANDIANDPFYRFIQKTYPLHPILFACAMYAWGGLPYLVWGVAVRTVWVWHITWLVNSASHAWGQKVYRTNPPDESRNNWWVGILAFGEGWHNNHHAFQYSARHGLEWWQVDMTYYVIRTLQFLGLATNVKLPTEAKKAAMRIA